MGQFMGTDDLTEFPCVICQEEEWLSGDSTEQQEASNLGQNSLAKCDALICLCDKE